jgi:hypothetical protein
MRMMRGVHVYKRKLRLERAGGLRLGAMHMLRAWGSVAQSNAPSNTSERIRGSDSQKGSKITILFLFFFGFTRLFWNTRQRERLLEGDHFERASQARIWSNLRYVKSTTATSWLSSPALIGPLSLFHLYILFFSFSFFKKKIIFIFTFVF